MLDSLPRALRRSPRLAHPSLRAVLSAAMLCLGALAALVSTALVVLTTLEHHAAQTLVTATESVRLAEEVELAMLVRSRASEQLVAARLDGALQEKLVQLEAFVATPAEGQLLDEARREVRRYLAVTWGEVEGSAEASLDVAVAALDRLVENNLEQARDAEQSAALWDGFATVFGLSAAALFLLCSSCVVTWLRRGALRPVLQIRAAMQAYAQGELRARAPEDGPSEFREIASQFNAMADALRVHREAQLAFLSGVAHDLRNPLTALATSTALVSPERPLPSEERVRKTLQLVQRQVGQLHRMVGDLLDVARDDAGRLELQLEPRDLRDVASEVAELYRSTSSRHELRLVLPDQPLVARVDATRLAQVLNNLVSNAIKYSPQGGQVEVALAREAEDAVVSVRDEGVGLSPEDQARLFEAFRRVGAGRDAAPGVGLGLFVAKRIVEAHGGRIELESEPGRGATFRVRIPVGMPARGDSAGRG